MFVLLFVILMTGPGQLRLLRELRFFVWLSRRPSRQIAG
jgi:hypothetical protein